MGRILDLVRDCKIRPRYEPGIAIFVEDSPKRSAYVAEVLPEDDPLGPWRREYLRRTATDRRGNRMVGRYERVPEGLYECRSLRRHGEMMITYVEVSAGSIEIIGRAGDEDLVRARLAGLDLEDLVELRKARVADRPAMKGSPRQIAYAEGIRSQRLAEAAAEGDNMLVLELAQTVDATWWIARRHDPIDRLRDRLSSPEWNARRDELERPGMGENDSPR